MINETSSSVDALLHVLDLPQIYNEPHVEALLAALDLLRLTPSSFGRTTIGSTQRTQVDPAGVPRYLTTIISSPLSWLCDDDREQVWNSASARLSERAGRTAMRSMTRSFKINEMVAIELHEPSLTEDNLGLKTWTSSLLLAKRLTQLRHHISKDCDRVLELGAGTGLVGIAAACCWHLDVLLTDLPEIVPNLQKNVDSNQHLVQQHGGLIRAQVLDWSDMSPAPMTEDVRFMVILAADPVYSAEHPRMLLDTVQRWLSRSDLARFILELPLRDGYAQEREELRSRLEGANMKLIDEGTEVGYDDWEGSNGQPAEVECWWSVWKPSAL